VNREKLIAGLKAKNIAFDPHASDRQLRALFNKHCRVCRTFDFAPERKGRIRVTFNDTDDDPAEIMLCEEIGKDPWNGEGVSVKDIRQALDAITPRGRALNFLVNSPGGSVSEGVAIRNLLNEWPGKITNTIIGVAASAASWCIPADETRAYKSSQMFIHRSWGMVMGNADDLRAAVTFLETTDGQIADIYADQTGQPAGEMLALMSAETLLTGQQALDLGLVDELIDGEAENHFTNEHLAAMKQKLAALNTLRSAQQGALTTKNQPQETIMKEKLALLNKRGLTPPANATEAQLDVLIANSDIARALNSSILKEWNVAFEETATDAQLTALVKNGKPAGAAKTATIEELQARVDRLTEADNTAKRLRIEKAIDQLIIDDKMTQNERDGAVALALEPATGEKYLESLNKRPAARPADPVGASAGAELVSEALNDIATFVLNNTDRFQGKFIGQNADKYLGLDEDDRKKVRREMVANAKKAARAVSKTVNPKNHAKIVAAWNTNTIDAGLQRQVIFTDFVEEYAITLLPFETFTKKYDNVPLEGTDEVDVPFYPLSAAVAQSWDPATGYATIGDTTLNTRPVKVGASATADSGANAAAGTAKDRKYIGLSFSSSQLRRQPYENWEQHAKMQGNALAVAIVKDVISRVVTAGNFGVSAKAVAAPLFSANDIADLTEAANGLNWPTFGRWLILDHRYLTPLLKDNSFKQYLAYGSTDPIRMAQIKSAYGFENVLIVPNLNNYSPAGENLNGWINHLSAVILATAPVMPSEEVMNLLSRYDLITHPQIDLTLEHRRFGNVTLDTSTWTVECSYGAAKLRASSLQRITSA
jgi:ATP-dependent protease ClpP protease subunit